MSGFTPKNSLPRPRQASPRFSPRRRSATRVFGANIPQPLQESGLRHAQPHVHQNGLENDRGDLAGFSRKRRSTLLRLLKLATTTLAREAFGMPPPPGNGIGSIRIAPIFGFGLDG